MEWTDRKDFDEKYNVQNNPELFTSWNTFARNIAGLAELKKKGLIDLEFLDLMMLTDITNWWRTFGEMTLESWKQGRYTWHSHFPFIEEVVKIDRVKRPWRYDRETGEYLAPHPRHRWIDPKEMMRIRKEMYQ